MGVGLTTLFYSVSAVSVKWVSILSLVSIKCFHLRKILKTQFTEDFSPQIEQKLTYHYLLPCKCPLLIRVERCCRKLHFWSAYASRMAKNRSTSPANARTSPQDFSASHPLLGEEWMEGKHLQLRERFCILPHELLRNSRRWISNMKTTEGQAERQHK